MNKSLHIVCADPPYPANCGCSIDTFQRIKSINESGVSIQLHYFKEENCDCLNSLNPYCESIHQYEKREVQHGSNGLPGLISAYYNEDLINNLNADEHPVLIEGIQCTGLLNEIFPTKKKVVRLQPIQEIQSCYSKDQTFQYFSAVKSWQQKKQLKNYFGLLNNNCVYVCFSDHERDYLKKNSQSESVQYLPAFTPWQQVSGPDGQGNYCLFHGNLSTEENETAAAWLITEVFTKARVPLIIAGQNPSKKLYKLAELCQHTCLIANPDHEEMNELVQKAQINVLPCFNQQSPGSKVKLVHALFTGRHCLVNEKMVSESNLEDACYVAGSANDFASMVLQLYHLPFTHEERVLRSELLRDFDNKKNLKKLSQWLW